ncbi:MAG TPA: TonB-dependent receptor [Candidatus Acidoferrum sp.]
METAGVFGRLVSRGKQPWISSTRAGNFFKSLAWVIDLRFLATFALLFVFATNVASQVPTGSIVGTVKDAQGLPVDGASVTLTNQGTNYAYSSITGPTGGYQFEHIDFGIYKVTVAKAGFKNGVVQNIKLDASTQYSVTPITLELGATTESIVVNAGAELVQTTSAEMTQTVEMKQIEALPILDRNPLNLVSLEAGVNQNGRTVTVINGQRESFANVTIDGINVQDNFIRTNTLDFLPNLPFSSQAAEFTITTSNSGPQDGGASAQVSIVTPSGTNSWHGQGFWYYRTAAWAANDWFNAAAGGAKPPLLQNQGGGYIGGPVVKNKLFVYGYYELLRLRQSSTRSQNAGVPATILSANAKQGLFTYTPTSCATPPCSPVTVNLLTLENQNPNRDHPAPVFTIDPIMANILSRTPNTANSSGAGDGVNTLGFDYVQRSNRTRDNYGARVDYNLNDRNSLTTTWSWNRDIVDRPDIDTSFDVVPLVQNNDSIKFLSTAWRWNPTSLFTNQVRFGFDLAPAYFLTSRNFSSGFLTAGTLSTNPDPNFRAQGRDTHTWSWQDNASWVHGRHTVLFGGQLQRTTIYATNQAGTLPTLTLGFAQANPFILESTAPPGFTPDFTQPISTSDRNRARNLLAELTGFLTSESLTFNAKSQTSGFVAGEANNRNYRQNDLAFYGGDSWRVNRKLTFNYGLRWEYFNPVNERNGLILLPVIPAGQTVLQTILSDATVDFAGGPSKRGLYNPDRNNFGPNVGIAWDPWGNGKMAVRAGYSVNYVNDSFFTAAANAANGNAGLSSAKSITNLNGPTVSAPAAIPTPPFTVPTTFSANEAAVGLASNAGFAIDPNTRTPYVQQWNVSVQREIGWNTSVQVSYVGNHGVGLFRGIDVNQVIIRENGFLDDFNRARANFFLTGNPACTTTGCQTLTFFPNLVGGGLLNNPTVVSFISAGIVGDLADLYRTNRIINNDGTDPFALNPLLRGGDILKNGSSSTWNAGIVEIRRRFNRGLYFQANYVFSKALTDYSGDTNGDQTRFLPLLDNAHPEFERSRANFDITHAFKANFTYELPIGEGHRLSPSNRMMGRLIGGWDFSSVFTWQTGSPYSIFSDEGLLNREARSSRETAVTTLTLAQLKNQTGIFIQPGGTVFSINPNLVNPDGTGAGPDALTCTPSVPGGFCNPQPGQQGNIPINFFSGPSFFGMDFAASKSFKVTESKRFEFRAEAFNVLNHPVFLVGDQYINGFTSTGALVNFGQSTSTVSTPRILQMALKFVF